jgi:membrane protease YdiL (CAAX protease family)
VAQVGVMDPIMPMVDETLIGTRKQSGFAWADIFLIASLGFVALSFVSGVIEYFAGSGDVELTESALWLGVSLNFVIFAVLPSAWVSLTIHGGWPGFKRYLGLSGGWAEAGMGLGLGVVLVMVFGGAAYLLESLGWGPENAPINALLENITWPLAIAFSVVAGVGEEILFRGILQKWLRWWGQGVLFGALHFANAGLFAFVLVGSIGLLFGYLRHRGISLWTLIIAHAVYNIILLSVTIAFPETAGQGGPA